ncbi:MAG TPA: hypothetical protein VFY39_07175 [Gammaproteobacteria bacterium]|nr:hypothetical protein [Gammaproteobacteria bacterium]
MTLEAELPPEVDFAAARQTAKAAMAAIEQRSLAYAIVTGGRGRPAV